MMLTVTMLQTPRVELDGREIVFPFKRVDALFYYMLVRRSATRHELTALLWEGVDDAKGLKNLRNTIYFLKKSLGGDFLLSRSKTTLQVNPTWEVECDYDHFMQEDNLSFYHGEFLQGFSVKQTFSFDIWMERTRDALRERYLSLLFQAAREAVERGEEERGVLLASDYLREEPCDESVAMFLMERFRTAHNYPRAAEVYQRLREQLQEELGTVPQRKTTELYYLLMDEWNRNAAAESKGSRELSGDALFAARLLSIFCGQASSPQLIALSGGNDESLGQGLTQLLSMGLVRKTTEGADECWRFLDGGMLEGISGRQSPVERQLQHRHAAQILQEGQAGPTGELCRKIAEQYQLASDLHQSVAWRIRGLDLSTSRCCEPSPVIGSDSEFLPDFDWAAEEKLCRRLLDQEQHGDAIDGLEQLLSLIRGRLALFAGDWEQGRNILSGLTGCPIKDNRELLLRACILLASACIFRQKPDMADRYVTAGEQFACQDRNAIWSAACLRLRGASFHLRGEQDKALYYLSEASRLLERLPDSSSVRLQTAAVRTVHGCIMRCKGDFAQASSSYQRALETLTGSLWAEKPWLCVHYGRMAFQMEDHNRAQSLFGQAYQAAHASGVLWGRGAAAAYLAYYSAQDEQYKSAADFLQEAAEAAAKTESALENGIVSFVSMHLRSKLDLEGRCSSPLEPLLPISAGAYARQGVRQLSGLQETFEASELARSLREGILTQSRYRAVELYSRQRHFMTE